MHASQWQKPNNNAIIIVNFIHDSHAILLYSSTDHSLQRISTNVDSIAMTTGEMLSAAKQLMRSFSLLLTAATEQPKLELDCLMIIFLQYIQEDTPEIQDIVAGFKRCSTSETTIAFLAKRKFLSYLNFGFLSMIKHKDFKNRLDVYITKYEWFMRSKLSCFAEMFMTGPPSLALPSLQGLHELVVTLDVKWKEKSFLHWKHVLEDNINWSEYVIIKTVRNVHTAVVITYYIYPFILSKVVQDVNDNEIIKQFSRVGATFSISDNTQKRSQENSSNIAAKIEKALAEFKTASKAIDIKVF